MARSARLLILTLAVLALAASAALSVTTMKASGATPVDARPSALAAHHAVAPSPVAISVAVAVARKAAPKPPARAAAHKVRKPAAAPKVSRPAPVAAAPRVRRPAATPEQLMRRAINRLPNYRSGVAEFILKPGLSNWGIADLTNGIIYIAPRVPAKRMYDVVAHEWAHVLSMTAYDGDVQAALDAMNAYYGGSGLAGAEKAPDCMARELGATWTHYTSCSKASWRTGARRLLAGQAL